MKDFEREEANIAELEQIGEFASFPMEEFSYNELFISKNEEFKVKEIQPQSFVENEEFTKKNIKNQDTLRKKLSKNLNVSSGASASSVSVATVTVTAAIATGIVVTPLFADYGSLKFNNYIVEVYKSPDNEESFLKGVYIYFDEELENGYNAQVINKQTNEKKELDVNKDYVYFDNLVLDNYNFEVQIIDDNKKVETSFYVDVNTNSEIVYTPSSKSEYLITYNDDNTTNLYYYPLLDYDENYNLNNKLVLKDSQGNILDYSYQSKDNLLYIENIKEDNYSVLFSSYLIQNGNSYLVNNNTLEGLSPYLVNWTALVEMNELTLEIDGLIQDEVKLKVEYLDLNLYEEFIINENNLILELSQISEDIKLTLEGEFITNKEFEYIDYYQGQLTLTTSFVKEIQQVVTSNISISRFEYLNNTYSSDYSSTPTKVYFEGYLKEDNYLNVYVYDSTQTLIASQEDIKDLNQPIEFLDLDSTQQLTLEYKLFDLDGNELNSNNYQFSTAIPEEYQNVSHSFNYLNPGSVYLSYNDDETFNAYFHLNPFSNENEYDVYYKIDVLLDDNIAYTVLSSDDVGIIENINYNFYAINYGYFVRDGLNYYVIDDKIYPSGTLGIMKDEEGYFNEGYLEFNNSDTPDIYELTSNVHFYSDLEVVVILDNSEEIKLTIALNDIIFDGSDSLFYLDLSGYEYSEAYIEVIGLMNSWNIGREEIENKVEIKGNKGCLNRLTTTIYK